MENLKINLEYEKTQNELLKNKVKELDNELVDIQMIAFTQKKEIKKLKEEMEKLKEKNEELELNYNNFKQIVKDNTARIKYFVDICIGEDSDEE